MRNALGEVIIEKSMIDVIKKHRKQGTPKRRFKGLARKQIAKLMKGKKRPSEIAQEQKDSDEAVDIIWNGLQNGTIL